MGAVWAFDHSIQSIRRWSVVVLVLQSAPFCLAQFPPSVAWSRHTHGYFIAPMAVSADGTLIASSGGNSVRLSNSTNGNAVRFLTGHTGAVNAVAFSPDGKLLASVAEDRTTRIWNIASGALIQSIAQGGGYKQFCAVAFHPDSQHVASDRNRTNVALWRVADGTSAWESLGNKGDIESVAFSPDGALLAVAGGYRGGDVTIRVLHSTDGQLLQSLITSNAYGVRQLAFSSDGKWLAAGCEHLTNFRGAVEIWRLSDWTRAYTLPTHSPALAFSPDNRWLITLRSQAMEFWRLAGGTLGASLAVPTNGNYTPHLSLAISPLGNRIFTSNVRNLATPNGTVSDVSATAICFPVILDSLVVGNGSAELRWTGGFDRYQIQRRAIEQDEWQDLGNATSNQSATVFLSGTNGLFRVSAATP